MNKDNILYQTNNGLDVYRMIIPDLQVQGQRCKNTKNPFYNDSNPSLSIYYKEGQWLFKDHGNETYQGDAFHFAAFYYGLDTETAFQEILSRLAQDLGLNAANDQDNKVTKALNAIRENNTKEAREFLQSRGINLSGGFYQSAAYKEWPAAVVFVNYNGTGYELRYMLANEELKARDLPKTRYFGKKNGTFYKGACNEKQSHVFICEAPMDALSFAQIGYSALATFGSQNIPQSLAFRQLLEGKKVFLAGDGDEAGRKFNENAAKLIREQGIAVEQLYQVNFGDGQDANALLQDNQLQAFTEAEGGITAMLTTEKNADTNQEKLDDPAFPVETFPGIWQEMISHAEEALGFPTDYTAAGLLYAASVAMGNKVKLRIKNGWEEYASLYMMVIGRPGVMKTHPLTASIKPLQDMDEALYNDYLQELDAYRQVADMSAKERKEADVELPPEPRLKQHILQHTTMEALFKALEGNSQGVGVFRDELAGWLQDFNRYTKGGDANTWLEIWNQHPLSVNRAGDQTKRIASPFVSLIGTIQSNRLDVFAGSTFRNSGFGDRFLIVWPKDVQKGYWQEKEMPRYLLEGYRQRIQKLAGSSMFPYEVITYSPEAKALYAEWYNWNVDQENQGSDMEKELYAKLVTNFHRLALILEMLHAVEADKPLRQLQVQTVDDAITLIEYFRAHGMRFKQSINQMEVPPEDDDKRKVALQLAQKKFSYRKIADILDVSKSTVGNWLGKRA